MKLERVKDVGEERIEKAREHERRLVVAWLRDIGSGPSDLLANQIEHGEHTNGAITIEPGHQIGEVGCPSCGASLRIEADDDEGVCAVLGDRDPCPETSFVLD